MLKVLLLFTCFLKITYQGKTSFVNAESFQTLSRSKRQSEIQCGLPEHPTNGKLTVLGREQDPYLPNSNVIPNTIIDLTCTKDTTTETGGLARAICYKGQWTPSISKMGGCVRRCPPVETEGQNLTLTCTHKSPKINCQNPIEGTQIRVTCKSSYEYVGIQPIVTCRSDGTWDGVISRCLPAYIIK